MSDKLVFEPLRDIEGNELFPRIANARRILAENRTERIWVDSYRKDDGSYVRGHWRLQEVKVKTPSWFPIGIEATFQKE